jgi:hypothetical protein
MTTYPDILIRRTTFMVGILGSRDWVARTLQTFLHNIYELYSSSLRRRSRSTYRNFFSQILKLPQGLTKSVRGLALDEEMKDDVSEVDDDISARRQ